MDIVVVGTGEVGGTLGRRWSRLGHQVYFASRFPASDRVVALLSQCGTARAIPIASAADRADVVVLATPWSEMQVVIAALGNLAGKVLIDCSNPVSDDFASLDLGHTTSAAEQVAHWAGSARVVKAFNCVSAAAIADPHFGPERATMFYCGEDVEAKSMVHRLTEELGLAAVDVGPLSAARFLEPFAMMVIQVAVKHGWGGDCALRVLTR